MMVQSGARQRCVARAFALVLLVGFGGCSTAESHRVTAPQRGGSIPALALVSSVDIEGAEVVAQLPGGERLLVAGQAGVTLVGLDVDGTATVLRSTSFGFDAAQSVTHVTHARGAGGVGVATIAPADRSQRGTVVFFDPRSLAVISMVQAGFNPDAVAATDNGRWIVIANEGEPAISAGGLLADPPGSIQLLDLDGLVSAADAREADWSQRSLMLGFDEPRLRAGIAGARIHPTHIDEPWLDIEPEYIAVHASAAFVSLQENNAIAVVDLDLQRIDGVHPLGVVQQRLDGRSDGSKSMRDSVATLPMSDQLASITIGSKAYLLAANEGDPRSQLGENALADRSSFDVLGDPAERPLEGTLWEGEPAAFGSRSLSVHALPSLERIGDTGAQFETMIAARYPDLFNAGGNPLTPDRRSEKRGPEPEGVVAATIGGEPFAFVSLERPGFVAVVCLAEPVAPRVIDIIPTGRVRSSNPEGMCVIDRGATAWLAVACEGSGKLLVYRILGGEQRR